VSRIGQCNVCGEVRKLPKDHAACYPCGYKARKARLQKRCLKCNTLISVTAKQMCKPCSKQGDRHHLWKGGITNNSGYRLIHLPDHPNAQKGGYVMEHVLVMSQFLGRALLPKENVHHLNGVRDDNRIENLELWSRSQPPGQRVVDKVAWAKEILALYGADFDMGAPPPPPALGQGEAAKALTEAAETLLDVAARLSADSERAT